MMNNIDNEELMTNIAITVTETAVLKMLGLVLKNFLMI